MTVDLGSWLEWANRNASFSRFAVIDVSELQAVNEEIEEYLSGLLLDAHLDPAYLKFMTQRLGWKQSEELVKGSIAKGVSARRGEFGEVILPSMCSTFHSYLFPVSKLRFQVIGGQVMPGTDALAIKLSPEGAIDEVCYCEAKLRTVRAPGVCIQGARQLQSDFAARMPDILRFVSQRLFERDGPLSQAFSTYMRDRGTSTERDSFRLAVLFEKGVWDEQFLQNLEDAEDVDLPRLTVHVVLIDDIGKLTDSVFGRIGMTKLVDDDD